MATVWGKSCYLGRPYFPFVFQLFVILVISRFGFWGGLWVLIAPVPGHCLLVTFTALCIFEQSHRSACADCN